jgi:soluble lytic murein transglycosylase
MQIMPETGEWIAREIKLADYTEDKLFQPQYNIPMGIWYLSYLDKVFKGDLPKLLASYNAGERKVKKWLNEGTWTGKLQDIDQIPYEETRKYLERVLFDYQVYKRIYKKS